jgi:transposase
VPGPSRPHRGGDRGANHALHTIALCRLRYDARTRAHAPTPRRAAPRLSGAEILRCLKHYIVREVYTALRTDFATLIN